MDKMQALKACQLFTGLPEENLKELNSIAVSKRFGRGELIFSDGDVGEGFYAIVNGRVKLFKLGPDGREQILHFASNGEPFGEVTLFAGVSYPAFARAATDLDVLFFRRNDFKALVSKDPQLSLNMIAIMSYHLRRFATLVEELSLKDVPARVARHLLNLASERGCEVGDCIEVELDVSKTELAQKLGTISETISRTLGKMRSTGIIDTSGRKVRILDVDMLEEIASGLRK
ncbi:MAG: Crp/Fnr family transcriptional regulator [Actinobacteria bacterium]|nr:Crp/Fnr family transcriptional regulator [Actinomycetota bacterium]